LLSIAGPLPSDLTSMNRICSEKNPEPCVTPPQAIFDPDPEYSKEARLAKYEGTCVIGLIVEADGSSSHITVISGVGKGLDEKAMDAVRSWKFRPATKGGKPVPAEILVEVQFHLH